MDFQNLEKEIKKYSDFFKGSQSTILKLSTFYKEIGKIGGKFADRMKKLLDEFYIDLMKEDRSTTFNKFLTNFYNEKTNFISKIKSYFLLLEKNYGERFSDFGKDHTNKNKDIISKLSKMNSSLIECKNQEDKWKNQYFDLCKSIVDTGKKIKHLEENENSEQGGKQEKADTLNKLKIQLTKYKDLKELKKKNYKEEQIKLNKLLEANENNYTNIVNLIEKEYCNKMSFVQKVLKEINQTHLNFVNEFNETIKKVDSFQGNLNIKRDARSFKLDYDFYVKKDNSKTERRFVLEEFLDYDYVIANNESSNNKLSSNIINNKDNDDNEYNRIKTILQLGESKLVDFFYLNDKGKKINQIIINLLNEENKIENVDFLEIINYIENNEENCKSFMDLLVTHFCQNEFIIIKNEDNFQNIIKILVIILNNSFDKKDIFDICFLIMFVAEKGIYFSKDDTQISSSIFKILSKQSIFNSINFWKDLINARIDMVAKIDIRKEFEKRRKNINNNTNGFFGKLFKGGKKEENENIENEILQSQILKEKRNKYFTIVFYDYIKHFSNFNFLRAEELLDSFLDNYNLDQQTINFFKKIIKSNTLCKNEKQTNVNQKNKDDKIFNFKSNKQFRTITDKSLKSIMFSLKYLDKSEYTSILCLNKNFNKKILKMIYKNLLLNKEQNKKIDLKKHLEIWKIILKYKEVKKEYDYAKIKESNKDPNKKILNSDIIDLDILRTFFTTNKEEKKEKLCNILKAIASELPELNYYQGMNQIAAFLLNICDDDEEEAFYIFMSFLKNSKYRTLFENDLEKMNCLFYQFERLLSLYLPEIHLFFKASSINSGYFISPWFITLFTNTFIDDENKNNYKSIMLIWDLFIFGGWKAIMKVGLILLKKKERYIMEKLSECLLPFLTGEILKSEILDSEHFDELMDLCNNSEFKISNILLKDLENEYDIKKNIEYFTKETHVNTY